jgi:hypothetical protein
LHRTCYVHISALSVSRLKVLASHHYCIRAHKKLYVSFGNQPTSLTKPCLRPEGSQLVFIFLTEICPSYPSPQYALQGFSSHNTKPTVLGGGALPSIIPPTPLPFEQRVLKVCMLLIISFFLSTYHGMRTRVTPACLVESTASFVTRPPTP